jgi:hypothetical chaperone protein
MKNTHCGIDFGTSNSALAVADGEKVVLAELENGKSTIPSAVFFNQDENHTAFGRVATLYRAVYAFLKIHLGK